MRQLACHGWIRPIVLLPLITILLPSSGQSQCSNSFFLSPPLTVGGSIGARVVTDDFNGDDIADLVLTGSDGLFIQFGEGTAGVGDGGFSPAVALVYIDLGSMFGDLTTADFNEDGILDLALLHRSASGSSLYALIGQGSGGVGDGTFSTPVVSAISVGDPSRLTIGDFDEDGVLDVAFTAQPPGGEISALVAWMRGEETSGVGNGRFGAATVIQQSPLFVGPAGGILAGDLDEDEHLDVIWSGASLPTQTSTSSGLGVLLGHGDGTYAPDSVYSAGGAELIAGDFNEDGIIDVATPTAFLLGRGVAGTGDGTFQRRVLLAGSTGASQVATGDFNGDGIVDIVTNASFVSVYPGLGIAAIGNDVFGFPVTFEAGSGGAIATGDFNEDGRLDLVVGSPVAILFGRCPQLGPAMLRVRDVPNDQGGSVFVTWLRSDLDNSGDRLITAYTVWRRIPAEGASMVWSAGGLHFTHGHVTPRRDVCEREVDGVGSTYWEALETLPAHFLEGYGYTAMTSQDSIPGSNPYTAFFVSALTNDPFEFFDSEVDSGYSVDNLAPSLPKGVRGFLIIESGDLIVHWHPNPEPDIHHYNVYRGYQPGFEATPATLIASPPDTMYLDTDFGVSTFYRVSAVDIHGNESRPPVPVGVGELPSLGTTLFQPVDRGGPIEIRFSIGARTTTRLEVFDVAGRLVRTLERAPRDIGEYSSTWDRLDNGGQSVSRGLYFVRLTAGAAKATKKLLLVMD